MQRPRFFFWCLLVTLVATVPARDAAAQPHSDQPASIIIFPKVLVDAQHDTVIEIANWSNGRVYARCFYVNAVPVDPTQPPGPTNPPTWSETAFSIALPRGRLLIWPVSQGRMSDGVLPVALPFAGELLCVETMSDGTPVDGNHLLGRATLKRRGSEDIAAYNAIGFRSTELAGATCPDDAGQCRLLLNNLPGLDNGQYNACPDTWALDFSAEGAELPQGGPGSSVRTELTIVPCTQDFAQRQVQPINVEFTVTNEFETSLSAHTTVTCWSNLALSEISPAFSIDMLGTLSAQTRVRPVSGAPSGIIVIAQEFDTAGSPPLTASAAMNTYTQGIRSDVDTITLPIAQ